MHKRQRLTSVRHPQASHITSKSSNNSHKSTTWVRFTVPSLVPVRSSRRLPRYELSIAAPLHFSTTATHRIYINPAPRNSVLIQVRHQVEPQEKKKTPKGRAKKRITYTRRFVNVTMTGGKRKVRTISILVTQATTEADKVVDEPQPYLVNNSRNWSLSDGAKAGTWIAHSLATPSIHHWAARPFPSPGIHDDDSKFWRICIADRLLFASRNKCRRRDWFIPGVFDNFFTTTVTSSEHPLLKCSLVSYVFSLQASLGSCSNPDRAAYISSRPSRHSTVSVNVSVLCHVNVTANETYTSDKMANSPHAEDMA